MHMRAICFKMGIDEDDDWHMSMSSGYLSDHGYAQPYRRHPRRPRSAMAMRPPPDLTPSSPTAHMAPHHHSFDDPPRNLPCIPTDLWGQEVCF